MRENLHNWIERNVNKKLIAAVIILVILCIFFVLLGRNLSKEPVLTLQGEEFVQVHIGEDFDDPGIQASLAGKDITPQITTSGEADTNNIGTYEITYTYERFKIAYSISRTVQVTDAESPELTLVGGKEMTIDQWETYEEPGYEAVDDSDGTITDRVEVTGYVDTTVAGTYKLEYSVTDESGNTTTKTRKVTIDKKDQYTDDSTIYLTFDDGPSSSVTGDILDVLADYDVKATFFICNYRDDEEDLTDIVQRELDEGHTVGIHTYSHTYSTVYASKTDFWNDFNLLYDQLYADTGYRAFVLRFPGGSSNTISAQYTEGIMSELVAETFEKDLLFMDWNVDSTDADSDDQTVSELVSAVKSELQEHRNNVVLMHDTNAKTTTVKAVKKIIEYGLENGYVFKAIEEDTMPIHHTINN